MTQIGFTAGMRHNRVTILNPVKTGKTFGSTTSYERAGRVFASYEFNKGTKALREGSLDAYDSVIFRMNFSGEVAKKITRESLVECDGKIYQIQSLNEDHRDNKIIIRATEMTTQVNIVKPEPEPSSSEI